MPIKIMWDDEEQTIIRWEFRKRWSAADFQRAQNTVFKITQEKDLFDGIIVIPATIPVPQDWLAIIRNAQIRTAKHRKDKGGITVFVCKSKLWLSLLCLAQRGNYIPYWYFADTLEGARALIAVRRRTEKTA